MELVCCKAILSSTARVSLASDVRPVENSAQITSGLCQLKGGSAGRLSHREQNHHHILDWVGRCGGIWDPSLLGWCPQSTCVMTRLGELFKWRRLLTEGIVWTARKSQNRFLSSSRIEGELAREVGGCVHSKGSLGGGGPCSR